MTTDEEHETKRLAKKQWLKTAQLYTKREASLRCIRVRCSDVAMERHFADEQTSMESERHSFEQALLQNICRIKQRTEDLSSLVVAPLI